MRTLSAAARGRRQAWWKKSGEEEWRRGRRSTAKSKGVAASGNKCRMLYDAAREMCIGSSGETKKWRNMFAK